MLNIKYIIVLIIIINIIIYLIFINFFLSVLCNDAMFSEKFFML